MAPSHKSSDAKDMPKRSRKTYVHIGKNTVQYYPQFQAPLEVLELLPLNGIMGALYISPSGLLSSQLTKTAISVTQACFLSLWPQPFLPIPDNSTNEMLAEITQLC